MSEIDALLNEDRSFAPPPSGVSPPLIADPGIYDRAAADPEGFWAGFARASSNGCARGTRSSSGIRRTRSGSRRQAQHQRQLPRPARPHSRRNKAAFVWEGEPGDRRTLTYWDLYRQVCAFANVLKSLGVKRGDRVALYLPLIPELAIAMLACARIGAIHSVVFGGFSSESLRDRINDSRMRAARDRRRRLSPRPDRAAQADGRRGPARARRRYETSSSCSGKRARRFPSRSRKAAITGITA